MIERLSNATFEIRKLDDELMDTVNNGQDRQSYSHLGDGSYYAVEIQAPDGFRLDSTPHYFEVEDGKAQPWW